MGKTKIEWTRGADGSAGESWNIVRGCKIVSEECLQCYGQRLAHRFSGPGKAYEGLTVLRSSGPRWTGKIRMVPEKLGDPFRWQKPRRVFVCSMSDLFHEDVPNEYIAAVFGVMALSPKHTFLVLTKRAARMRDWFRWISQVVGDDDNGNRVAFEADPLMGCAVQAERAIDNLAIRDRMMTNYQGSLSWPAKNIFLGVSAGTQQHAEERIPLLLQCPAAVHWVSAEPLLGSLDLTNLVVPDSILGDVGASSINALAGVGEAGPDDVPWGKISWLVAGGESGPGARPCHPEWARSLRDQCSAAGVAYFWKQWGAWAPTNVYSGPRERLHTWSIPSHQMMERVGKKAAGRELDGRTWDEYPEAR